MVSTNRLQLSALMFIMRIVWRIYKENRPVAASWLETEFNTIIDDHENWIEENK